MQTEEVRRMGDNIKIDGGYQYYAIHNGNPIQRHWHMSKILAIDTYLPAQKEDIILDVGCGSGVISHHLALTGALVYGIDGNEDAVHFSKATYNKKNLHFINGFVDELNFEIGSISKIYCLEVVEHLYLPQVEKLICDFYRLLKPGGKIFLTTPNYKSLWPMIEWTMDKLKVAPQLQDDQHVTKFNKKLLEHVCLKAGFSLCKQGTICTIGPWIAPFSNKMAERITRLELTRNWAYGSILVNVFEK